MADSILLIYLHPIQTATTNNLLPTSLLDDATKIQTSLKKQQKNKTKKTDGKAVQQGELSHIAGGHVHSSNYVGKHFN